MIRYAGRIWSSLVSDYGLDARKLSVDHEIWIADFISDAYADGLSFSDVVFRIANEYGKHGNYLDEKRRK